MTVLDQTPSSRFAVVASPFIPDDLIELRKVFSTVKADDLEVWRFSYDVVQIDCHGTVKGDHRILLCNSGLKADVWCHGESSGLIDVDLRDKNSLYWLLCSLLVDLLQHRVLLPKFLPADALVLYHTLQPGSINLHGRKTSNGVWLSEPSVAEDFRLGRSKLICLLDE